MSASETLPNLLTVSENVWTLTLGGYSVNLSSPPPIGNVTPNSGAFTTLSASGVAELPHIHGSIAGNLYIHVQNTSGVTLAKGTPVYVTGNVGDTDRITVSAADNTNSSKMPVVGLLETALNHNQDGNAVIVGELTGVNTSGYTINQKVYVGNGILVGNTPIAGVVQLVGIVARVQSNTGVIVVNAHGAYSFVTRVAGRTGDVTLESVDIFSDQVFQVTEAGNSNVRGTYVYGGEFNGAPIYYKDRDTFIYYDEVWTMSYAGDDQYFGEDTEYPWQSTSWNLGAGTNPLPSVGRLTTYQFEQVVGRRTNPTVSKSKTYAVFTALDNQPPSTAFATPDTRNSIAVLDFDDATDESAVFVGIMPEGASLNSGLKIRLHWMATSATSGNCVWGVSLERMSTDLDSDSFGPTTPATVVTNVTSGRLTITEISTMDIDGVVAGEGFRLKVTRDADNGSDNMSGDAELVAVEVRSAT